MSSRADVVRRLEAEARSREAKLAYDRLAIGNATSVLLREAVAVIEELHVALDAERARAVKAETLVIREALPGDEE